MSLRTPIQGKSVRVDGSGPGPVVPLCGPLKQNWIRLLAENALAKIAAAPQGTKDGISIYKASNSDANKFLSLIVDMGTRTWIRRPVYEDEEYPVGATAQWLCGTDNPWDPPETVPIIVVSDTMYIAPPSVCSKAELMWCLCSQTTPPVLLLPSRHPGCAIVTFSGGELDTTYSLHAPPPIHDNHCAAKVLGNLLEEKQAVQKPTGCSWHLDWDAMKEASGRLYKTKLCSMSLIRDPHRKEAREMQWAPVFDMLCPAIQSMGNAAREKNELLDLYALRDAEDAKAQLASQLATMYDVEIAAKRAIRDKV